MAGGIVAGVLVALVRDPAVLLVFVFLGSVAAVSMLQVNYGVYSALLTPTFVLLAETGAPDPHLPGIRVVNTLIGGALALAAARLLWPAPEGRAFRGRLADAIHALAAYMAVAAHRHAGDAKRPEADAARRAAGVAVLNAEESLQLVLWEARRDEAGEAGMAALAYVRRLAEAANLLAYAPTAGDGRGAEVARFGERAAEALEALSGGLEAAPATAPAVRLTVPTGVGPTVERQLASIAEDVEALAGVLVRGLAAAANEGRPPAEA
jgi:uncharacterized membrane protein YccC